MNGSRRKYVDRKCLLCLMKLVLMKKCCQKIYITNIFLFICFSFQLQSIKKQMNPKKSLFHFGSGSKKKEEKCPNPHLVTEAQELNEKLNEIDRTLNQQQNSQIASSDNLNKQGIVSPTSPKSFILSKPSTPSSKSHRLGLKPIWLRNSRLSKENRTNNRLSTPPSLLQSWGKELTIMEVKSPSPTSSQDTFLKSLDLADGVSKDDKPSDNVLYKTLPTKKNLHMSYLNQGSSTHNKLPKYVKILDTEIEVRDFNYFGLHNSKKMKNYSWIIIDNTSSKKFQYY